MMRSDPDAAKPDAAKPTATDLEAAGSEAARSGELASPALVSELAESLERLEEYAAKSRSENTLRAYAADLEDFRHWCARFGRDWLPAAPETVALYLGSRSEELALATLERRLASINAVHKDEGYAPPATVSEGPLRRAWRGIVKEKTRRQDKAEPLMAEDLRQIISALPRYSGEPFEKRAFRGEPGALTLTSLRDRALLLTGWAAALRRSELVAIQAEDLELVPGEGYTLYIGRSKQDQAGRGLYKGVPYGQRAESCPVLALRTWTGAAAAALGLPPGQTLQGPIFRRFYRGESVGKKAMTAQYVSRILKTHAARVGLEAADYSAHSLRSGFITQAIRRGKRERRVKEHSGHASWEAFGEYVRRAGTFEENPAKDIGL